MPVKAILLMAIIVAGSGVIFLIVVGLQWWRAMKNPDDEIERINHEGQEGHEDK